MDGLQRDIPWRDVGDMKLVKHFFAIDFSKQLVRRRVINGRKHTSVHMASQHIKVVLNTVVQDGLFWNHPTQLTIVVFDMRLFVTRRRIAIKDVGTTFAMRVKLDGEEVVKLTVAISQNRRENFLKQNRA